MSADPVDIMRATRRAQVVQLADSAVLALYPAARDALEQPDSGTFETAADALAALAVKADLVGAFRRRHVVQLAEELEIDPLVEIPTVQLIDAELGVDAPALPMRVQFSLANERTTLEVIG